MIPFGQALLRLLTNHREKANTHGANTLYIAYSFKTWKNQNKDCNLQMILAHGKEWCLKLPSRKSSVRKEFENSVCRVKRAGSGDHLLKKHPPAEKKNRLWTSSI